MRDVNFQTLAAVAKALQHGPKLDEVRGCCTRWRLLTLLYVCPSVSSLSIYFSIHLCIYLLYLSTSPLLQFSNAVLPVLAQSVKDSSFLVRRSVVKALYEWLCVNVRSCPDNVPEIVRACVTALQPEDREVRVDMLKLLKKFFKAHKDAATHEVLNIVVAPVVDRAVDKRSFPVKLAAERLLVHLLRVKTEKQFAAAYLKSVRRKLPPRLAGQCFALFLCSFACLHSCRCQRRNARSCKTTSSACC